MLRAALCLTLLATPVLAEEHTHLSEKDGLRVQHAWTRATAGPEALVYFEAQNQSAAEQTLTGGEATVAASVDLVGFSLVDAVSTWTVLPGVPVQPGQDLDLVPEVLALRLSGLTRPLAEGDDLDIMVHFGATRLEVEVEVGAADATAHSHAGHQH